MKTLLHFCLVALFAPAMASASSNAWNQKADFGGVARHRGAALSIGNKGYMGMGHYNGSGINVVLADWWEFDPSTNTWTQMANYPFGNYALSCFTAGNKGYVGAGIFSSSVFYAYDPLSNTWAPVASLGGATSDQVGFGVNGKGYYVAGTNLYEYDPGLNTWTLQTAMPFSSWSWSSTFTIGDKAYLKTGNQLWEYKSLTDEWAARAIFPGPATGGSAAFCINGKGYIVCGGYIGWLSELVTEVWEYDPALNTWTQLEDFPGMARRFTAGFAIGDKGYMGIGTNGTNFRDFWEFDELLAVPKNESTAKIAEPYPNPSSSIIHFSQENNQLTSGTTETLKINVTDLSGRKIYSGDFSGDILAISKEDIGTGIFLYEIFSAEAVVKTGKIIFE
jgi:N-acetylneuraminic acid mutarotase